MTSASWQLTPRPADSLEELLEGAGARTRFDTAETRSGARFERVQIGGKTFVVKHVQLDDDFTMRASGDVGCRPLRAYAAGLLDLAPDLVDHGIVSAARGLGRRVATDPWGTVQFGWEKALGDEDDLGWWCDRAREGLALL